MSKSNVVVNTIPYPKMTALLNDFIIKTINHLNKLSVYSETKLNTIDKKIREIDIMVKLLESKLNSLPDDITSKYPPIQQCSLNDITPEIIIPNIVTLQNKTEEKNEIKTIDPATNANEINVPVEENKIDIVEVEEKKPETPEEKLKNFLERHQADDIDKFYKMLKFGIPSEAVIQKANFTGFSKELINELIDLYKASNPNFNY